MKIETKDTFAVEIRNSKGEVIIKSDDITKEDASFRLMVANIIENGVLDKKNVSLEWND